MPRDGPEAVAMSVSSLAEKMDEDVMEEKEKALWLLVSRGEWPRMKLFAKQRSRTAVLTRDVSGLVTLFDQLGAWQKKGFSKRADCAVLRSRRRCGAAGDEVAPKHALARSRMQINGHHQFADLSALHGERLARRPFVRRVQSTTHPCGQWAVADRRRALMPGVFVWTPAVARAALTCRDVDTAGCKTSALPAMPSRRCPPSREPGTGERMQGGDARRG
ncbi:hypothetical protein K458DRAFT_471327 [Lentithecium fluviatile CBS 122367]|uniref:Uncharacterized protein n=1 Tax=Lentithecium fluviatile CBS 122367 TaxID=1168545 RepID=A0A6G1J6E0_9PLEO|nr:hypothetical protein K458DRAFT_471327 [Lentithecium fluviatile CBS 122367]